MMPKLLINQGDQGAVPGVLFGGVRVLGFLLVMWAVEVFKLVLALTVVVVLVIGPDLDRQTPHQHQLLTVFQSSVRHDDEAAARSELEATLC